MTIQSAIDALTTVIGDRVSRSKSDLDHHGMSESYYRTTPPDAVVYPNSTEEVVQILKACSEHDCPVIGWGTGTSLEGHALATRGGVTVDFSRMNKVLSVNDADMNAVVQPGVTREQLNMDLRATGLFFSVDPGANASLGGMASTRASGTTSVRYGTMRDNVLALEVVLADGRVIRTGTAARKSSAGYDLTHLFVGSEGTLGLITELTVKLHGQPEAISAAVCAFPSVEAAVDTVIATIQMGVPMARIELVDEVTARAFNAYSGSDLPEMPHLMIEFHGSSQGVAEDAARFGEIADDFGALGFQWSDKEEDRKALWAIRHNAHYANLALRPGCGGLVTDICVPISKLAQAISETRADIEASPLMGPMVGHVGDGNVHCILLVDRENSEEIEIARRLGDRMADRALRLGGTITGEHGVGIGKRDFMRAEHGDGWDVMGSLKQALDPQGIMNPGKLVPDQN